MADVSRPSLIVRLALYARRMIGSTPPGETVVVCPPKQMPAKVQLDSDVRIVGCTRLPSEGNCEEACAAQLQYSPTILSTFLSDFEGKACEACGKMLDDSDWYASRANMGAGSRRLAPTPAHPLCFECWNKAKFNIS